MPPLPPPLPAAGYNALVPSLPVWGLFGRWLLMVVGQVLIVPSPWTTTNFYRFVASHVALPGGFALRFTGRPEEIWPVVAGIGLLTWVQQVPNGLVRLTATLLTWVLLGLVLRWICARLEAEDGSLRIAFTGSVLAYAGWHLLLILSLVTVIGWAWILKAFLEWICSRITGTHVFRFEATGLAVLGHTLVLIVLCAFIVPIPWAMQWYASWLISRISIARIEREHAS